MQPAAQSPIYIFLDFDGVLRHMDCQKDQDKLFEMFPGVYPPTLTHHLAVLNQTFDPKAMQNLNELIDEIGKIRNVFIVITSAWRQKSSKDELVTALSQHKFSQYVIDKTPDNITKESQCTFKKDSFCRAGQIHEWLQHHPEVMTYFIIDDNDQHLSENFKEKYYEVSFKDLLTEDDVKTMIARYSQA